MAESPDPYRDAVRSVLPAELLEELDRAEGQFRSGLAEGEAAKGRAMEIIRMLGERSFEVLEHELELEYAALVRYHAGKLAKKVRWILEAWKDTTEEEGAASG